ncbi:MAG TPA: SDR family oxidoreductase [Solirubrobacteraceae bacterium]|jgi:NAD(P)-dependent dehydrogenase (short-subunit alcohol dehydrogenase family)|nr:SDR family oxidoreductase [Solirubrobacteraceae bacterium]
MSDPWRLDERVALVVGAGRGLGRGCAIELARAGARVVLVSRTRSELDAAVAAAGHDAVAIVADATQPSEVQRVVQEAAALGSLGVLVVAAGTNRPGAARDYPIADWDLLFDLNVRATFLACQAFGDALLTRGLRGSIVTLSSQLGSVGYPGRVAYCATKHAVDGITRALAVEWARDGIRVNAVAPTFVETPLTKQWLDDPVFRAEVLERRLPTGQLAEIDDVAHAVRYLACDASNNVTGHILKVDGGWTAW